MYRVLLGLCFIAVTVFSTRSLAGGMFLPCHGVRAMGRGCAFAAGADDPSGIWYNPATIGSRHRLQILVDAALVFHHLDYTRVDSGGNHSLPTVSNQGPLKPIPSIAFTYPLWKDRLFIGASLSFPYSPFIGYPEPSYKPCESLGQTSDCIATAHRDAPQRYTAISNDGTMFPTLDLAVAYAFTPKLIVGASFQNVVASWVALNSISSYTGAASGGPEDPEYDLLSQLKLLDLFNPSAKFGIVYQCHPRLKLATSFQLPVWVNTEAQIRVKIPVSPLFEKSSVEGRNADVSFLFPAVARFAIEGLPLTNLHVEVDFSWEMWSQLDTIDIHPLDIYLYNIPGFDRIKVPDLAVVLKYQDAFSVHLGAEYRLERIPFVLRSGYIFERGATKPEYQTVNSYDSNKHLLTIGVAYTLWGYRMDLAYAHVFFDERTIDYRQSKALQINPVNPEGAVAVGGGNYQSSMNVIGVGVNKVF